MSNLLSPKDKKKVKREYLLRLVVLVLLALGLTFLIIFIASIPSYFLSEHKVSVASDRIDFLESLIKESQASDSTDELTFTNEKIKSLRDSREFDLSGAIQFVLTKKTSSIKITALSIKTMSDVERELIVKGIAQNRESLISFSDGLKSINRFVDVDLPISNLAKNIDIEFSLKIKLKSGQTESQ